MKILNINSLDHQQMVSNATNEKYSLSATLSEYFDFKDIFIHHEVISPGQRSSSSHAHTIQEEMIVVIKGNPTVHIGLESSSCCPGDFIGFKPGECHFVENTTTSDVQVLVICSKSSEDEVIFDETSSSQ